MIAILIDERNKKIQMSKELPQPSFPVFNVDHPADYLDFQLAMQSHLSALTSEKLKLSTLKQKIQGSQSEKVKQDLVGVETLEEAFRVLSRRFGSLDRILPERLDKIRLLTAPKDFEIAKEVSNTAVILTYLRIVLQHNATQHCNGVFIMLAASKLRERSGLELLELNYNKINDFVFRSFQSPFIFF